MHLISHEIIECPAVLVELSTGSILAEYHTYVKPTKPLSAYCIQLTGISQNMVDYAPTLENCLPELVAWLKEEFLKHSLFFPKTTASNMHGNGKRN
jgi:inhibitor of KinA sporulation pathway (predicted exonuclease)